MTFETLPIFVFNFFGAVYHGLIFLVGFALLKHTKTWLSVVGLIVGLIAANVLFTFAAFFLHGRERAWSMILPSGEMFAVMGLPVIINTVISTTMIVCAVYALFVSPGNKQNV